MNLDEAIAHAREVAEKNRKDYEWYSKNPKVWNDGGKKQRECLSCAEEHEQLAEWLEEYKWLKKQKEMFDPFNFSLVCARKESYEKAIDDFACYMCNEFDGKNKDIEEHTGEYVIKRVHSIAEQLKEGAGA